MPVLKRNILGLDIGSSSIKWVLYSCGKGPVLYDWGILAIPAGWVRDGRIIDTTGIASKINGILKGIKGKVSRVSLSLSCPEMIIRTVYMPKLVPKELYSAIKYEIEQLIPAGTGEYISDYRILGEETRDGAVQVKVLIAALQSAIVREYMELLSGLNLKPFVFDFHGNSASRVVTMLKNVQKGDRQLVVDVGESSTTITFMENGAPVFTRLLQKGGGEMTSSIANTFNLSLEDAEQQKKAHGIVYSEGQKPEDCFALEMSRSISPTAEQLLKDIYRSVEFYRSRNGRSLDSVIAIGGGSHLKGFGGYIASNLDLKKVSITEALPTLARDRFSPEQGEVLVNALGLALREDKAKYKDINLLPEDYRNIRKRRRAKRAKVLAGLLAGALAVGAIILPLNYRDSLESMSIGIQHEMGGWSRVMEYRQTRDDLEKQLAEREETVHRLCSLGMEWSALLEDIGGSTPSGVRLESVSYLEGGMITIYGIAPDYKTVAQFVVGLRRIEGIEVAEPVGIALIDDYVLSFETRCFVGGEGDGE